MNAHVRWILLVFVSSVVAADRASADWQVWTLTETRRVLRDEPAAPASGYPARGYPGTAVNLAAARSECESFQILIRSDVSVRGVNVRAADLAGPDGALLRAADARLFRQHQLQLTVGTSRNKDFKPGWYPDPLIPFSHPLTGQPLKDARLSAVPFDLPANQTHSFWVDVCVPPDAKPGVYRGVYRVTADDGRQVQIPVTLNVWDFALPRVSTMQTALGSPADHVRGYYRQRAKKGQEKEPADWAAVETQCAEMLSQHRINATPPPRSLVPAAQDDGTYRIPAEQIRRFREFVDRYHVNAVQVPNPTGVVKDPEAEREKLHAWLAAWDRAAAELQRPQVVFYTYLIDEPNDKEAYQFVQKWGPAIRAAKSVVKVMVVEQPWTEPGMGGADSAWGDLYGAVDIWCPLFSLFRPEPAAQRQALGETVWAYTALCQGEPTPWWHIDYPLLNYRVPAWIAWRYRIRGLLYWGGMSYWNQVDDPWTDPKTYCPSGPGKPPIFNGEGTLVYPARAVGYDGIAPSLRLKALRDSIEDYEYLAILERLGRAAEAEKVILPLSGSWFKWETDPAAYQQARARLAELILAAQNAAAK